MDCLFLDTVGYESALRLSGHHYARLLAAQGHRVLSLSSPVTPAHWFARSRNAAIARRFQSHNLGPARPFADSPEGLLQYVPFSWFPVHRWFPFNTRFGLHLSCVSMLGDLMRRMQALDFSPKLISLQSTQFTPFLWEFPEARVWYRMEDLLSGFSGMPRSMIVAEKLVMHRADLITVTSPVLMESAVPLQYAPKTMLLPNGVDAGHFAVLRPRPSQFEGITRPIALYVGALREWFNWDWLRAACTSLPEIQFVLISPDPMPMDVGSIANLMHLGGVPYEQLPSYIQHADVGIIPFVQSPLIQAVSPIKLLEFFACGKPVVSMDWLTLRQLSVPASLAKTAEEFSSAILRAVQTPGDAQPRLDFARENSWARNQTRVLDRLGLAEG